MLGRSVTELLLTDEAYAHNLIEKADPNGLLYRAVDADLAKLPNDRAAEAEERIYFYGAWLTYQATYFKGMRELVLPNQNETVVQSSTLQVARYQDAYFLHSPDELRIVTSIITEKLARTIGVVAAKRTLLN